MKNLILTDQDLIRMNVCESQLERFQKFFPNGINVSEEGLMKILNTYDNLGQRDGSISDDGWHLSFFFKHQLKIIDDVKIEELFKLEVGTQPHKNAFLQLFKDNENKIKEKIINVKNDIKEE